MIKMYEDLKHLYDTIGRPTGRQLKSFPQFTESVKDATSWLESSEGRIEFKLRMYCIFNNIQKHPSCVVCGKDVRNNGDKFSKTCSAVCRSKMAYDSSLDGGLHPMHSEETSAKRKQTNMSRYGVDNPIKSKEIQEKCKKAVKDKYGVENVSKLEFVKDKRKKTNLERYGVENCTQNAEIFQRAVDTLFERYGVVTPLHHQEFKDKASTTILNKYGEHFTKLKEVQDKKRLTNLSRYGVEHVTQMSIPEESLQVLSSIELLDAHYSEFGNIRAAAKDLVVDTSTYASYLSRHKIDIIPSGAMSYAEKEIHEILKTNNIEFTVGNRTILDGLEADIVIEDHKLLIEYNGVYWHSELFRNRMYHQNKTLRAMEKGYNIIHVWEDDWENNKDLVINKILHKCGKSKNRVYARKCIIKEVSSSDLKEFYNKYHIQGNINSSVNLALVFDGSIVAGMSFKKKGDFMDLTRYATSISVVGGFSKLLKHFIKTYSPDKISTFASLDYSSGDMYESLGFARCGITPPNYDYIKSGKRYSRNQYMKHMLKDKLEVFDPLLSEVENMRNNGYFRLFDSGSIKFEMILNGEGD